MSRRSPYLGHGISTKPLRWIRNFDLEKEQKNYKLKVLIEEDDLTRKVVNCDRCMYCETKEVDEGEPEYYTIYYHCHRFPEKIEVSETHWCGEFDRSEYEYYENS